MSFKDVCRRFLSRQIKSHRILRGPLAGKRIVTSWHDYPAAITGRTERPLLDWLAANVKPGETWLDIGAHYGYTAIALCQLVGESGRVFAFEPMIGTAGYLTQTRQLNSFSQLNILPLGLSAPETLEMKCLPVIRGMVDSTLEKVKEKKARRKEEKNAEWRETIIVSRFDWLWQRICGEDEHIDGIKIDVQGMEIEVLKGMIETLRRQKPKLVIEMHHGVDRHELLGLLDTAGYSRHATPIHPVDGESTPQFIDDRSYAFQAI